MNHRIIGGWWRGLAAAVALWSGADAASAQRVVEAAEVRPFALPALVATATPLGCGEAWGGFSLAAVRAGSGHARGVGCWGAVHDGTAEREDSWITASRHDETASSRRARFGARGAVMGGLAGAAIGGLVGLQLCRNSDNLYGCYPILPVVGGLVAGVVAGGLIDR